MWWQYFLKQNISQGAVLVLKHTGYSNIKEYVIIYTLRAITKEQTSNTCFILSLVYPFYLSKKKKKRTSDFTLV